MSRKPKATSPSISANSLRLFRLEPDCRVLGPGRRAVLWVQGCSLGCAGCLVADSWPARGGFVESLSTLASWIVQQPDIEGITLSGGEPFEQAGPLATLLGLVRGERDLGVVCYTGYTLEALRQEQQQRLLSQVDLLIDGPYRRSQHADLLWRGSTNQRLLFLSPRYAPPEQDCGAGLEFRFDSDGRFTFAGVPPWADFVTAAPFQ